MSRSQYPGRRPTKPPTVAHAIDELITYTDKWLRRYDESWFDQDGVPATALGFNPAGDLDKIPEFCDYAIGAVSQMAKYAKEAESKLANVKKEAEKRIEQRASE